MRWVIVVLLLAIAFVAGYLLGVSEPRVYTEIYVMEEICEYSHKVQNKDWEDACGLAQSASGRIYQFKY